jgi:hypothetical protein
LKKTLHSRQTNAIIISTGRFVNVKTNKPMEKSFTRLITYRELLNCEPDLYSDAFGIDALTAQIFIDIEEIYAEPDDKIVLDLLDKIRNDAKVH